MLEVQKPVSLAPFYRRRAFLVPFCIIVLSLIPKLLIMPIVFHADIISLAWSSRAFAIGTWDIYDAGLRLWVQDVNVTQVSNTISHGPLFFYPYGVWMWLNGLLGTFPVQRWVTPNLHVLTAENIFILKLPELLVDLVSAFFVSRIFEGSKRNLALGLWLFAPMTLYFTYATGQDDIFMISCICGAFYFAARSLKKAQQLYEAELPQPFFQKEALLSVALLGIGTDVKLFSLFFLPVFVIILSKRAGRTLLQDWRRAGVVLGFGLLPIVLVFGPLALLSKLFLSSVLGSSEATLLGNMVFYDGLGTITWFWLLYFMLIAYLLYDACQHPGHQYNFYTLMTCAAGVAFLYLIISNYPAQFMIWSLPVLVIMVAQRPRLLLNYLILTFCQVIVLLLVYANNLDLNGLWNSRQANSRTVGTIAEFISKFISPVQVVSMIGPIAVINLLAMLLLYRRSVAEPLLESWYIFRKRANAEVSDAAPSRHLPLVIKLGTPLVLFVGLVGGLYFLAASSGGARLLAQEKSDPSPVALLLRGTVVRQDFVAPVGQLERLEVMFNTSDRLNLSKVDFALYQDGVASPVVTTQIDAFYVRANIYYSVKLPQVLKIAQATNFYYTLSSPDATAKTGLATSSVDVSKLTGPLPALILPAQVNGVPTTQALQFRLDYGVDWGQRWQILLDYFGETPVFSVLYFVFCILLGILFVVGLFLLRSSRPKPLEVVVVDSSPPAELTSDLLQK